jgi:hypothetical protein
LGNIFDYFFVTFFVTAAKVAGADVSLLLVLKIKSFATNLLNRYKRFLGNSERLEIRLFPNPRFFFEFRRPKAAGTSETSPDWRF